MTLERLVDRPQPHIVVGKLFLHSEGDRRVARQTVDRLTHDRPEVARGSFFDEIAKSSGSRYGYVESQQSLPGPRPSRLIAPDSTS